MKRAFLLLALLVSAPAGAETVAITGAKVWTGTSTTAIEEATIVIVDGRIASIDRRPPPSGARVIQATGRVVTPALSAAATQIGLVEMLSAPDTDDRAVASGPLGAAFDVSRAVDPNGLTVQEARAQGISRAMVFPGAAATGAIAGRGALLHLTQGGNIVSKPRAALFAIAGGSASESSGGSRGAVWTLLRNALDEARAYRARGASTTPRDQLLNHLDADALLPVLDRRIPLAIVANREADIRQAIELGRDAAIRVVILGGAEAWRVAPALAAAHIPVVLDPLDELPVSFDAIGARRDNAAILARAGVTISFSVSGQGIYLSYDVGPALREGAGIAVANGLPYPEALKAITASPAAIWGDALGSGTLSAGGLADLVIWDGDPLEPSSAPAAVFVDGREVSLTTRQTLLRDRYAPQAARR